MSSLKRDRVVRTLSFLLLLLVVGIIGVTSFAYARETSAFRFFDEENNIVAGYFLTNGKQLYTDVFMNHNPLTIEISAQLQRMLSIQTLFELVNYHRVFMIALALCANIFLLIRFRHRAFLFIFVYEFIKFYLSGQMFLAEGMIAYVFAYYVLLLVSTALAGHKVKLFDLVLSSLGFVFICLSREPYVPLALVFFGLILFFAHSRKIAFACGVSSMVAIVAYMLQYDLSEFYKQVVLLNRSLANGDLKDQGGAQMFSGITQLYQYIVVGLQLDKPLYMVLGGINIVFGYIIYTTVRTMKKYSAVIFISLIFVLLFLAGIRNYKAGAEWYGMYRSIPYIAILLAFVSSVASLRLVGVCMIFTLSIAILHPRSHLREKRVNADEYYIQYSKTNQSAQVIDLLCSKYPEPCTIHIDDIDVYPYWITKKPPSYQYAFYYPVNKAYLDYRQIRERSLTKSPPVVYFDGSCMVDPAFLPKSIESQYHFLNEFSLDTGKEKQACIAVHETLIPYIDEDIRSAIAHHQLRFAED